jgi:uncharacterized protein (DUF2164 family)
MSQSGDSLASRVNEISTKAAEYETADNFEAKKQRYLGKLDSVEDALDRLNRRVQRMEFLATILVDVVEGKDEVPGTVEDARRQSRSVVDYDKDWYYQQVDADSIGDYEQKVQQAQKKVKEATNQLENELDDVEQRWQNKLNAARNVQKLFGHSSEKARMFNEIEAFVERRMKDDSESIPSLRSEWSGLQKQWNKSGMDWQTFQRENNLSDKTIDILQRLAEGRSIQLRKLDGDIAKELLSVDELRDVVKIKI